MRTTVVMGFLGSFLQVFGAVLLVPLLVVLYYSEPWTIGMGFALSAALSLIAARGMRFLGKPESPTVSEAMLATVLGWVLAIAFGAIPLLPYLSFVNALFESAAGLTTTGISVVAEPESLPLSILFWRSFMQWIGGLGILTFFIAVIRESGGASRRLFSAEAHKTDSGSIRPSLTKSIIALWKVYGFLTVIITATYILLGMPSFDAMLHAFSAISTGGFSTMGTSIGGFNSVAIESATVLFMFIGGVNFVLLYKALQADFSSFRRNSEFRLYTTSFLLIAAVIGASMLSRGLSGGEVVLESLFTSAAFLSSTGYGNTDILAFGIPLQILLIGVMFVGGSLGSTSGGWKMFRLKTMMEMVRTRIRAYSLPETAINEVKIDGEIMDNATVRTISVLFFIWVVVAFGSAIPVVLVEDISFMAALSGSVSAAGNMGPVFLPMDRIISLTPFTKFVWIAVMIAGRLEMLPVLAIFNSKLFKH